MDSSERMEAAQALLDAPDSAPEAPPEAAEPPAPAEASGAEAAARREPEAAGTAQTAPERKPESGERNDAAASESLQHPLAALLEGGKRTADSVRAAVADADLFHAALRGETPIEAIADFVRQERPEAWEKLKAIVLAEAGAPPATKSAGPDESAAGAAAHRTGAADEVAQLRQRVEAAEKSAADAQQRGAIIGRFLQTVEALGKKAGLEPEEIAEYADAVSRRIGADAKALARVENGAFGDVERLFNEVHGRMLDRAKRWADRQIASKRARDGALPKTPVGGAPPAPATRRLDLADREARVAAATESFRAQ